MSRKYCIVSAAVRLQNGQVIMCVRHLDGVFYKAMHVDFPHLDERQASELRTRIKGHEDGFVDNRGEFLTREQAWPIADAAGQIIEAERDWQTGRLHSEHLY